MRALLLQNRVNAAFSRETVYKDTRIAGRIRLALALAGLMTVFLEDSNLTLANSYSQLIFFGYVLFAFVVCMAGEWGRPFALNKSILNIDCFWYAAIVYQTGGSDSFFFVYFLVPVFVASLGGGFEQGARMALLATLLFTMASLAAGHPQFALLLFRSGVLLALGYLTARLGENKCQLQRRMELLHGLTQVSNFHFGFDRTVTAMLERTRSYFNAERCVTVICVDGHYYMRSVAADSPLIVPAEILDHQLARTLLAGAQDAILLYRSGWRGRLDALWPRRHRTEEHFDRVAELLGADSFIGAPAVLRSGFGRVFVVRAKACFDRADAMFLSHVVAQSVPVAENMALLDRIASNAASNERKKFALNLHDCAVQPYIGLTMGLAALRKKAGATHPLAEDLDRLLQMAEGVIAELRAFAGKVRGVPSSAEPLCLRELRRQAEQMERCFGIQVSVQAEGRLAFGDRICAEVVQIVREGLSNICRHTNARHGVIQLRCDEALLRIEIDNDNAGMTVLPFVPRSISERASALGGRAYVKQGAVDNTAVCVEIPI